MTFLTPLVAAIAAGIAIPALVALYFLKLRRREVEVSTTLLWKRAIQDLQANAPFQRLRRNILLILQLAALGAALVAVGTPRVAGREHLNSRHIIMIDRSASMSALDGDESSAADPASPRARTRLEVSKQEARKLVDSLPEAGVFSGREGSEAMVVVFDTTAEVRQQFTGDKSLLRAAIDAILPTDAPTRMGEAMRLAKAHSPTRGTVADPRSGELMSIEGVEAGEPVTVHIWSDGKVADLAEVKPGLSDEVVFHRVGRPESANMGIVGLRWERSYEDPTQLSIFASVQSTFDEARRIDVELSIGGQIAGIRTLELPAAEVRTSRASGEGPSDQAGVIIRTVAPANSGVVFQVERSSGAIAQVRLRATNSDQPPAGDMLAADNSASMVIPPARKLSVAAVTRGNLFLAAALEGLPLARLDTRTPEEFQRTITSGQEVGYDVVILDSWLPESRTPGGSSPSLPAGRYLILGSVPPDLGIVDRGMAGQEGATPGSRLGGEAVFIDWMRDHAVLRNLTLDPVVITEMRMVEVERGSGAVVMAQTSRGPGIIDASSSDGQWRAIVVPFDIARGNWAFDVSFVVFMASAVEYLGGASDSGPVTIEAGKLPPGMVQPGTILSDRLPVGARDAKIRLPASSDRSGPSEESLSVAPDGRIVYGPIRVRGLYEVGWTGPAAAGDSVGDGSSRRMYAANLLDPSESDIGASDEIALASRVVRARAGSAVESDRPLWRWFLLAALAVVMLEWFVYNRKVHV
ncbi:MAG: VWA domain-containing protein [Phycisphaeraceae bacterium]|nr:VWA domain-containing protein [Phycisphaerae bacterium]MBX3393261.1 VWA domain-containing protein [Phycisphaeraceae bacterium]